MVAEQVEHAGLLHCRGVAAMKVMTETQQAVIDAAQLIDAVFVEWSTFAMPKELRVALNTLHQRVRALGVTPTTDQGELTFERSDI
jgi:hypothetical protein